MPLKDRDSLIALLNQLGSPTDAEALAAARQADAQVKESGLTWDAVIERHGLADDDDDAPGHVHAGPDDDAVTAEPVSGDVASDLAQIERLLKSFDLSIDTREMLEDFKDDIKQGSFTAADRRYLQSLEARLKGGKKSKN